jgi:molybdopterin converting factor small subunit
MASISFAQSIRRHVEVEPCSVEGKTVAEVLERVFEENERLRGYLLDDRGAVRKHVSFIVNGTTVRDRANLSDTVAGNDEIFVMQALSGG